jgi:DNA polymerase-3 subunit alpha
VQLILDGRRTKGAFAGYADFCRKVDPGVLTKRVLESLITAGAFDSLHYRRKALLEGQDRVSAPIAAERKAEAAGQFSLFGGGDNAATEVDESVLSGDEFDKRTLLRLEKEVLGQFVTDHPLLSVKDALAAQTDMELSDVGTLGDGDLVRVAGIVATVARKFTKKGDPFAQFRLEDLTGGVTVVAFPNVYEQVPELIEPDAIVLVTGRADLRGRELQLRAVEVAEPDLGAARSGKVSNAVLVVDVAATSCTNATIAKLKELLGAHPGRSPVRVRYLSSQGVTPLDVGTFRVDPGPGLMSELRALLGHGAVEVVDRGRQPGIVAVPDVAAARG